ncbi:MAG: hypothetical protein D6761_10065 [Candidatus Dadabacteria bacterium]|nr:MAG: hypothetical protein D6761_10065 [Candidatus Dadabacteria bacterium]
MAKKKRKKSTSPATRGGAKAKALATPSAQEAGSSAAFVTGVIAATALAFLFPVWYSSKAVSFRGIDMLLHPTRLPAPVQNGLNGFGGAAAVAILIVLLVAAMGLGFFWTRLYTRPADGEDVPLWRRIVTRENGLSIVSLGLATGGLAVLLVFLNMQVINHREWPVVTESVLLFLAALASLRGVAAVDAAEGRGNPALSPLDWGIWLGGLIATALFHYLWICYVLIRPAPKALVNGLLARFAR